MYQSGNNHKTYANRVSNGFVNVSIGKHNIEILKNSIFFLTQKVVKIKRARSFTRKHDHFILHALFAKSVACTEAHKNQRIQGKNEKLSKPRRVMHFWT